MTEEKIINSTDLAKIKAERNLWRVVAGVVIVIYVFNAFLSVNMSFKKPVNAVSSAPTAGQGDIDQATLVEQVLPGQGVTLPAVWGDLGQQMVAAGVIDQEKFSALYEGRGGLAAETRNLLMGNTTAALVMTEQNAGVLLNLLWGLGLGNKNAVLDEGPMQDPQYGGAGNFASTGGWTIAAGDPMNHYSQHQFIILTPEQQTVVERVAKNIYRPCCGNSVHFPDCNHGMAMLGLLELMASQGVGEEDMYKAALQVNSYWFPDTYLTLAKYFGGRGVSWLQVNSQEVLGSAYSSGYGYQQILAEVEPVTRPGGGGCGV